MIGNRYATTGSQVQDGHNHTILGKGDVVDNHNIRTEMY